MARPSITDQLFENSDRRGVELAEFAVQPIVGPKNTRSRFVCPACDVRAWSRASARPACLDCNQPLVKR